MESASQSPGERPRAWSVQKIFSQKAREGESGFSLSLSLVLLPPPSSLLQFPFPWLPLLLSHLSLLLVLHPPQLTPSIGSPKSSFLHGTKLLCQPSSFSALSGRPTAPRFLVSSSAKSFNHIPNQFREENLKDEGENLHE